MFNNEINNQPMYANNYSNSRFARFLRGSELLYHSIVKSVRKDHSSPIIGLLTDICQSLIMVGFFMLFQMLLGKFGGANKIRGNPHMFIMSGIYLFIVYIRAMGSAKKSGGPTSVHSQFNSIIELLSSGLSTLYIQVLSFGLIILVIHYALEPVTFQNPKYYAFLVFLSWFFGLATGSLIRSLSIFFPRLMKILDMSIRRGNMIFSGKLFVVNMLPPSLFVIFAWNPLFHLIDQGRGAVFVNYTPYRTNVEYAIYVTLALFVISFMIDHAARKYESASRLARG